MGGSWSFRNRSPIQVLKILIFLVLTIFLTGCNTELRKKGEKSAKSAAEESVVFQLDPEQNAVGNYTSGMLLKDVGSLNWYSLENRAAIAVDPLHGKVLRVMYPKGSVGPSQGGIQFDKPLPESGTYYLDYYLKFEDGFDFAKGGKLPGLTSGGEKFTGGIHPEKGEGWSARYMWRKEGEMIVYLYHMDMPGKWGDAISMNTNFETGRWYRLTQHITLNTGDQSNGILDIWVDAKKVVQRSDIRYRMAPLGSIDSFYFSTFHGGNTSDWAPQRDSYIDFDDFKVSETKPQGLE